MPEDDDPDFSDIFLGNGINARTGDYVTSEPVAVVARVAEGGKLDAKEKVALRKRLQSARPRRKRGPALVDTVNRAKLEEAGWAVVFLPDCPNEVREALKPLLDHRRDQAGAVTESLYREYAGPQGYQPGESSFAFLQRQGVPATFSANPKAMPYYVLLVGDPETMPYRFQHQLDVARAAGRLHFDTAEEYARYAESVVAAETSPRPGGSATFVGVRNADDKPTQNSADMLVGPLAEELKNRLPTGNFRTLLADQATKAHMGAVMGGAETPSLLFTASHGVKFDNGDVRQLPHQGALLCQDWPGPVAWKGKEITPDFYFAGEDIPDDANVSGMIAFFFACYGGGTPKHDEFSKEALEGQAEPIAPHAFVGRLPQRLLSHPKGGALAVVGHVEKAFSSSFKWGNASSVDTFADVVARLLKPLPVGAAVDPFHLLYASLATDLEAIREAKPKSGESPGIWMATIAALWGARNDARNYAVFGDPAVRMAPAGAA